MEYKSHFSVLNKETIDFFKDACEEGSEKLFLDLTFGAGGHTFSVLNQIMGSKVIAFDQDLQAIRNGEKLRQEYKVEERLRLVHSNFQDCFKSLQDVKGKINGIILDAGVSSHQFDCAERGFSFRFDAPLDMRMNSDDELALTAEKVVNEYSLEELTKIISEYGEDKFAYKISRKIVEQRTERPIVTTKELENLVFHAYPKKLRYGKTHPATKTFQALRIEVNKELEVLSRVISFMPEYMNLNGVFCAISFHSLEDRIVKKQFKELEKQSIPVEILTKKPILPSEEEIFENSRSRSAKLRVLKRVLEKRSKNKYAKKGGSIGDLKEEEP
jgi:16S rRNA (cytosine1402-N4)-methyltransferase